MQVFVSPTAPGALRSRGFARSTDVYYCDYVYYRLQDTEESEP